MDGGLDKRGYPTGSDAKGKFSIVQVMDNQKEFKIYHTANSANRTPEDAEKHREMYFKMAEEYRIKKAPYNKAKEMGFELKECTQTNLIYKGEEVAHHVMASWYADDDDYNYYSGCQVYVKGTNVGVRGTLCEVGADRPGMSYRGKYAFIIGTLDGDKFVKGDGEQRDLSFE